MDSDKRKSFLELKIIWKDNDMIELGIIATNGRYFGTTEVYDTSESLINFAKSLIGYPKGVEVLIHQAGQIDSYAYFEMKFYSIDSAGHIGVQISLEENISTNARDEEKDKIKLEIIVEPSAIDKFQKQLLQLAVKEDGVATLYGRNY